MDREESIIRPIRQVSCNGPHLLLQGTLAQMVPPAHWDDTAIWVRAMEVIRHQRHLTTDVLEYVLGFVLDLC